MIPFYHQMGIEQPQSEQQPWRHTKVCFYQEQPCPEPIDRLVIYDDMDVVITPGPLKIMIASEDKPSLYDVKRSLIMGTLRLGRPSAAQLGRQGPGIGGFRLPPRPTITHTDVVVAMQFPVIPNVCVESSGRVYVYGIDQKEAAFNVSGDGHIECFGRAETMAGILTGHGTIDASGLVAENGFLINRRSGTMKVHVNTKLLVKSHGMGRTLILGGPTNITKEVTGTGTVEIL
jgi:hypothetical protein